jgi:hypothetical protein
MDAAVFGNWEASAAWVPPCDEPAAEEVAGYYLCAECAEMLRFFGNLAHRTPEARENARRALFYWRLAMSLLKAMAIVSALPIMVAFGILVRRLFP